MYVRLSGARCGLKELTCGRGAFFVTAKKELDAASGIETLMVMWRVALHRRLSLNPSKQKRLLQQPNPHTFRENYKTKKLAQVFQRQALSFGIKN